MGTEHVHKLNFCMIPQTLPRSLLPFRLLRELRALTGLHHPSHDVKYTVSAEIENNMLGKGWYLRFDACVDTLDALSIHRNSWYTYSHVFYLA